jgi:hypothetical protein
MVSQVFRFNGHNSAHYEMSDYDFDNMTISEFCAITDFFPSSDDWLWELERIQVTRAVNQLDRNRWVYSSDLKRIIDNYNEDYQKFKEELPKINQSLVDAFADIKARLFDDTNFCQFLDLLTFKKVEEYNQVLSPYGTVTFARIRRR